MRVKHSFGGTTPLRQQVQLVSENQAGYMKYNHTVWLRATDSRWTGLESVRKTRKPTAESRNPPFTPTAEPGRGAHQNQIKSYLQNSFHPPNATRSAAQTQLKTAQGNDKHRQ